MFSFFRKKSVSDMSDTSNPDDSKCFEKLSEITKELGYADTDELKETIYG